MVLRGLRCEGLVASDWPVGTMWFAEQPRFPGSGMIGPPSRRCLPGPAPEGTGESARLRIPQNCRDLAERHVGVLQQLACDLEANFICHLPKWAAFHAKVTAQRAAVHRKETGDRGGRTRVPEQFGPKHPTQISDERLATMARRRLVSPAGGWRLHGSFPFPAGLPLPYRLHVIRPASACLTAWDSILTVWEPKRAAA